MNLNKLAFIIAVTTGTALLTAGSAVAGNAQNIDKVHGSAEVSKGEQRGDISLVNGSITLNSNSSAKEVTSVNGGITIQDNVKLTSASTVNGSINAGNKLQVEGALDTVNGRISVGRNSTVGSDVTTVNGDITLTGSNIGRNITTVNGDIRLEGNTVVKGDVIFKERSSKKSWFNWSGKTDKRELYIAATATVEGQIILEQPVILHLENPAMQDKVVKRYNDGR